MNSHRIFVTAALTTGMLLAQVSFAQDGWTLAKDAEDIKVYVRNVADSPLREFRGEIQIKTTTDNALRVLRDADGYRKWMPDVATSELLSASDNEQIHYLDNKAPWPVSNRDGIYQFTYSRNADGSVFVRVQALPNHLPTKEGKVRIPQANGQWKLIPTADGVQVSYQMHASPGGSIPTWLANQTVVDTPFGTLKAMRAYLQSAR